MILSFEVSGELSAKWVGQKLDSNGSGGSLGAAFWGGPRLGAKVANVRAEAGIHTSWNVSAYSEYGHGGLKFKGNEVYLSGRVRAIASLGGNWQYNSEIIRASFIVGTAPNFQMSLPTPNYN
jgi:hypothetical protein